MTKSSLLALLALVAVTSRCQAQTTFFQPTAGLHAPAEYASATIGLSESASVLGTNPSSVFWTMQDQAGDATGPAQPGGGGSGASGGGADAVKQSQNPIASLVSLPVQSNWNFGIGPDELTQYTGLLQPVIPLTVNKRLNLITRPILPLINSPDGSIGRNHGLGDMQWQNFFVPVPETPSKLTWGIGPSFILPTASNPELGRQVWGVGVSGVAVYANGPVVAGMLVNQNWTETNASQPFLLQPFFNYNFENGILKKCFFSVSGEFQADWNKDTDQWNNLLGVGIGRGVKIMGQPMSISTRFAPYLDPIEGGPKWQFRFSLTALFPK